MYFEQKFTVHPVGQGLFYTGVINFNTATFRFVFDCGSVSRNDVAQKAIDQFISTDLPNNSPIDLLIISHFDADHINQLKVLLNNNRKVKKIIAPFIDFEERVVLALKFLAEVDTNNEPYFDFIVDCIIDLPSALSDNLDENAEIILIDSNPGDDRQFIIDDDDNSIKYNMEEINEITFEMDGKSQLTEEETNAYRYKPGSLTVYRTDHINKGKFLTGDRLRFMDLFFYRKTISSDDKIFFKKVFENFIAKSNDAIDIENVDIELIVNAIKKINSGGIIKQIFEDSCLDKDRLVSKKEFINLNTTSLCMLHRNKVDFYAKINRSKRKYNEKCWITGREIIIQNLNNRTTSELYFDRWYYKYTKRSASSTPGDLLFNRVGFPNVLLTSDTFLKEINDVNSFCHHYAKLWDQYFLFQIPHHGSDKSSDKKLYCRLPFAVQTFINYGVTNGYSHPSSQVILDLTAANQANRLLGIHEYIGLQIILRIT